MKTRLTQSIISVVIAETPINTFLSFNLNRFSPRSLAFALAILCIQINNSSFFFYTFAVRSISSATRSIVVKKARLKSFLHLLAEVVCLVMHFALKLLNLGIRDKNFPQKGHSNYQADICIYSRVDESAHEKSAIL